MENTKTIKVGEREAVVLVPETTEKLALVDLGVLTRLACLLPRSNFSTIKDEAIQMIANTSDLEGMIRFMKDEVAFHTSVNLIVEYDITSSKREDKVPAR